MQTVQGRVKREGIMLYSMSRDVHMLLVVLKTRAHKGHKVANEVIFGHKKQQMTGLSIPCAGDVHFFSRSLKGSFTGDQVQSKKCSFFPSRRFGKFQMASVWKACFSLINQ